MLAPFVIQLVAARAALIAVGWTAETMSTWMEALRS